jgi:hypothetical protein
MNQNGKQGNGSGLLAQVTGAEIFKFLFSFGMTAFGILAAYYTTIAGIKLELVSKADSSTMAAMEKKMTAVEIQLSERFMTREDFYRMKEEISGRLAKIETNLEQNSKWTGNRK